MTDRNRELVPHNWNLVRETALTTGLCSEGWYSEHSGICRRAELPGLVTWTCNTGCFICRSVSDAGPRQPVWPSGKALGW